VNAADIVGNLITSIDIKEDDAVDVSGSEVRNITFYTIVTSLGRADVILHVDHNGYYGGELCNPVLIDEFPEGLVEAS